MTIWCLSIIEKDLHVRVCVMRMRGLTNLSRFDFFSAYRVCQGFFRVF